MRAVVFLAAVMAAAPAAAMTHTMTSPAVGARAVASDPDEGLERLAAAGTAQERSHGKPPKSVRNILKDDPNLRTAYASLDNR